MEKKIRKYTIIISIVLHILIFFIAERTVNFRLLGTDDIPEEILRNRDTSKAIPPLYGALVKNEQDVQLLERLAFMNRRQSSGGETRG